MIQAVDEVWSLQLAERSMIWDSTWFNYPYTYHIYLLRLIPPPFYPIQDQIIFAASCCGLLPLIPMKHRSTKRTVSQSVKNKLSKQIDRTSGSANLLTKGATSVVCTLFWVWNDWQIFPIFFQATTYVTFPSRTCKGFAPITTRESQLIRSWKSNTSNIPHTASASRIYLVKSV